MARYSSENGWLKAIKPVIQVPSENLLLVSYKQEIEKRLSEIYTSDGWISSAAGEAITAGGKRLRPIVTLLTCEAICGNPEPAFPVALAYELAHSASLIQDDIIDESEMRHARPTAIKRYGLARAIMLSDTIIFEIFTRLSQYEKMKITKTKLAQLLKIVGRAARLAAEGEMLDVILSQRSDIKMDEYIMMVGQKTGALFAASAASGAVVGGANAALIERMYEFGLSLGTAFQIRDDVLDLMGDAKFTGKPTLKDLQNNAGNLVLLHALSLADPIRKNAIRSLLFKTWFTPAEADQLLDILHGSGSFEYAEAMLATQTMRCRFLLESLQPSYAKNALEDLIHGLETRKE